MYQTPSIETMAQYDYQQQFEADPTQQLSVHELFDTLVTFRKNTVNKAVSKLITMHNHQAGAVFPNVQKAVDSAFQPFSRVIEEVVPMVDSNNPFDTENMMQNAVEVSEVSEGDTLTGAFYEPDQNGYVVDTPDSVRTALASDARTRIEALSN